ncbi:MAG: D-alanine--D-alanine ligase [Gammaproteobacteria bacterium]|nr:D-alanine--D-alanine ligase [Gammaproteobacteria bacterium]
MYIEIITTPNDTLKESGFGSLNACNSVLAAIEKMGHRARLSVCSGAEDLAAVVRRSPDLVVPAVKYVPMKQAEDIWLSDYFSQHGIHFTGSSRDVLKFDSNKVLAKTHLTNKGINTARHFMAVPGQYESEYDLPVGFPLFIKPLDAANGNGIDDLSFVTNFADYHSKVASLYATYKQPVLVEEYLDGREFTVAVIRTSPVRLDVSAVEVIPPTSSHGLRILGAQAKKDDSEQLIEIIDDEVKHLVTTMAIEAFNALGVRDYGRIDIKTDNHGSCFFMEANLVPGMTFGSSYFPEACALAHELGYDKVVKRLLAGGISRASSSVPPNSKPDKYTGLAAVV